MIFGGIDIRITYTNYPNSRLATALSAFGGIQIALGIPLILCYGAGLIFIAIGYGWKKLAKVIANNKNHRLWMKSLRKEGVLDQIPNNTELAIKLYEANPSKKTLKFIRKVNPQAAMIIVQNKQSMENKTTSEVVHPISQQPEAYNINRDHYEQLYLQSGLELMQQRGYPERVFVSIIANTELIEKQNNDSLLMIYAYLRNNPSSIDAKRAIITAEYVYRILRSRNCERYK